MLLCNNLMAFIKDDTQKVLKERERDAKTSPFHGDADDDGRVWLVYRV